MVGAGWYEVRAQVQKYNVLGGNEDVRMLDRRRLWLVLRLDSNKNVLAGTEVEWMLDALKQLSPPDVTKQCEIWHHRHHRTSLARR
jgi:hypothetical protein